MIWPIICIISNYNSASSPPKIPGGVKETYFHNQGLWFIKLSPIENVKTRFQKEWCLYFYSLCTICHKKRCVFLPKRKDDWNDVMGYNLGKYTEKQICIKTCGKIRQNRLKWEKKVLTYRPLLGRRRWKVVKVFIIQTYFNCLILREAFCVVKFHKGVSN